MQGNNRPNQSPVHWLRSPRNRLRGRCRENHGYCFLLLQEVSEPVRYSLTRRYSHYRLVHINGDIYMADFPSFKVL
jgi:hypothetical protein